MGIETRFKLTMMLEQHTQIANKSASRLAECQGVSPEKPLAVGQRLSFP